jgi:hypothetical protein
VLEKSNALSISLSNKPYSNRKNPNTSEKNPKIKNLGSLSLKMKYGRNIKINGIKATPEPVEMSVIVNKNIEKNNLKPFNNTKLIRIETIR